MPKVSCITANSALLLLEPRGIKLYNIRIDQLFSTFVDSNINSIRVMLVVLLALPSSNDAKYNDDLKPKTDD